jgi:hypothetical protein
MNNNYYDLWVERWINMTNKIYNLWGLYMLEDLLIEDFRLEFMNDLISYFGLSTIESQLCALD